ncbi:hypothetical protein VNI00_016019 [Paramarasmius palmivorus]|uniref:Uncharacterized protein n=1 Tax=Paramarasmius palmivorus TaxID=297713 RepID=A0AAW0BGS7_9AGAR
MPNIEGSKSRAYMDLTDEMLLVNKHSSGMYTALSTIYRPYKPVLSDPVDYTGGIAARLEVTWEFITSPNDFHIPEPPVGSTRDLYRRADGRYGLDDPIQHPQPFNSRSPYLPCIPARPLNDVYPFWTDISSLWKVDTPSLGVYEDKYWGVRKRNAELH